MATLHRCPECGKPLEGRANKITCSPICKGRRDRREKPEVTVKKLYEVAHDGIMGLVGYSGERYWEDAPIEDLIKEQGKYDSK